MSPYCDLHHIHMCFIEGVMQCEECRKEHMASQSKHTPGPWDIHEDSDHIEIHPLSDTDGTHIIADVVNIRISRRERQANANLIASAPELLEALKSLFEHCAMIHKHWGDGSNQREADIAIVQARTAIAKAEGR